MFCKILIVLWFFPTTLTIKENTLLESLQCYNDYKTNLDCTWNESRKAFSIIPMQLYYIETNDKDTSHVPLECNATMNNTSLIVWTCHKEVLFFVIGSEDFYVFKPSRKLKLKVNVTLITSIKPRSPQNLKVTTEKNDDFLLTWETAYGNHSTLYGQLQAEVSYKRDWESWEAAQSVFVADSINHLQIQKSSLVPGNGYVARVRLKPHNAGKYNGQWSNWSSEVKWQTPEGDEAEPKNLQCTFDGIEQLVCTWEVKKDVSESILYILNYMNDANPGNSEEKCRPVILFSENNDTILYSCTIKITNHSTFGMYQITIRPEENEKEINPTYNIKFEAPRNLTVEASPNDGSHKISWKPPYLTYSIALQYELLYKKLDDSWETAKLKRIEYDTQEYIFGKKVLEPAATYVAKIRTMVKLGNEYNGTWSEWSSEVQWKMPKEFELWILALVFMPAAAIMTSLLSFYGYKHLRSAKSRWEDGIPNPKKSSLWSNIQHGPLLALSSSSLDLSPISPLQTEQRLMNPVFIKAGSSDIIGVKDLHQQFIVAKTMDIRHSGSVLPVAVDQVQEIQRLLLPTGDFVHLSSPSKIYIGGALSKGTLDYDLNGPYLTCPHTCSLPDLISDMNQMAELKFKNNTKGYTTLAQYCTESMPLLESQSPDIHPSAFNAYPSNPSQVTILSHSMSLFSNDYVRSYPSESTGVQSQSLTGAMDGKDKECTSEDREFTYILNDAVCIQDESSECAEWEKKTDLSKVPPAVLQSCANGYIMAPSGEATRSMQPYLMEVPVRKEYEIHSLSVMKKYHPCSEVPDYLSSDSKKNLISPGKTGDFYYGIVEKAADNTGAQDFLANGQQQNYAALGMSEKGSPDVNITQNTDEIQGDCLANNSVPFQLLGKEDSSDEALVLPNPDHARPVLLYQIGDYCCISDVNSLHQTSVIPLKECLKEANDITALHSEPLVKQKEEDVNLEEPYPGTTYNVMQP